MTDQQQGGDQGQPRRLALVLIVALAVGAARAAGGEGCAGQPPGRQRHPAARRDDALQ
jgi:hypothetical protein